MSAPVAGRGILKRHGYNYPGTWFIIYCYMALLSGYKRVLEKETLSRIKLELLKIPKALSPKKTFAYFGQRVQILGALSRLQ